MTKLQQKVETVLAGLLYVAIGTVIAVQVNAQSTPKKTAEPACDSKAPGAVCGISETSDAKPDMKICFGAKHARCYELNKLTLRESVNNMTGREVQLKKNQVDDVMKSVKDYRSWLEAKKAGPNTSVCRNAVTLNIGSESKEFCTGNLPRKEMQERNKELFKILDAKS